MGLKDMKPSNQTTNDGAVDFVAKAGADTTKSGGEEAAFDGSAISSALWSSDGLVSTSRLFQRSSSTPPTHVDVLRGATEEKQKAGAPYDLSALSLREAMDENNQDDDDEAFGRHDLVMPLGKHIQRSWSAPPVPENFDTFFPKKSSARESQRTSLFGLGAGCLPGIDETHRAPWSEGSDKSLEKTSVATVSPLGSPLTDEHADATSVMNGSDLAPSYQPGSFYSAEPRRSSKGAFMTLVDRVQEDFPRTPSPVFGAPPSSTDEMMAGAMSQLHVENSTRPAFRQGHRRNERNFSTSALQPRVQEARPPHRAYQPLGFVPTYPVVAPPGFQAPSARGIYGSPMMGDPRASWTRVDEAPGLNGRFHFAASDYGGSHHTRPTFKADLYPAKHTGGIYGHVDAPRVFPSQAAPVCPTPVGYEMQGHHFYGAPPSAHAFRSKLGFSRRHEYPMHPAHIYNSTTLLEEFKSGAKSDKWDLRTIQGHLAIFARDQTGSRFIQQKLEKADDAARQDAFDEVYPDAMDLMTDVFGNYVIQKFFDHGSIDQQRRLVNLMKDNMVELALQVYGCRVIQKALEVTQVDEQLLLIRELRGHVLRCVVDQNGNHVLQKCIEAASWKKNVPGSTRQVTGEDIQFIIDDFVGQAAILSTHAYGCRVIQRVLEHCTATQIRPIVNEIMYKCRELVKDQFGNYVVQHVICHGEVDQRNVVMEAILPDVAKWSQHKYASNVVEACLDCASKKEISQIVDLILDCDESGSSCALLPMMKHMYGNYVVQKLLDRADRQDRQRIVRIIQHNAEYLRRFTYGKHVLSRLEREMHTGHMY